MTRSSEKSDGAFRTIREVADWLGVPTHVLRFWESKFDRIAPVKGAGGRRYYRPEDMRLLGGIKVMLHDQGMTIRAVSQKIEEEGTDPVMDQSPPLEEVSDGPPPRTRRVIRQGEDTPPPRRVVALDEARRDRPAVAREGASPPQTLLPDQPDAPVREDIAGPEIETLPEAPDDRPLEDDGPVEVAAPYDPADSEPSAPADPGTDDGQTPDPDPLPAPSLPATIEAAQVGFRIRPSERKRLRRVVRRLRALRDEIAEDLAEGDGP